GEGWGVGVDGGGCGRARGGAGGRAPPDSTGDPNDVGGAREARTRSRPRGADRRVPRRHDPVGGRGPRAPRGVWRRPAGVHLGRVREDDQPGHAGRDRRGCRRVSGMAAPSPLSFASGAVAEATRRSLAAARAQLGVRRTALFWLDDAEGRLACVATTGPGGPKGWVGRTLAAGVGMAGRAVREGRAVWTPDLLADPHVPVAAWLRERMEAEGLRAVAAAPVKISGATRGALGFLDRPGRTLDHEALGPIRA